MPNRPIGNIQKLAEGKYLLRFSAGFDDFGKRIQVSKTVYCASEKEAERLLMEFHAEKEKRREERVSTAPATLQQLYDEWMHNHVNTHLAANTQAFYTTLWDSHLKDKGQIKLKSIKPRNIYQMMEDIDKDRTKNALFKMIKTILKKGVQWGYLADNVCDRVEAPRYKAAEKKTLSEADISQIIDIIGQEETKYQAIFYLAAMCGLRRQEIVGLKWTDVDFANGCFMVNRAAANVKGKGTVEKETKTNKSVRKLFMPEVLKMVLLTLNNEQQSRIEALGDKWQDGKWIFTQWNGQMMSLHTPTKWWGGFVKENTITPTSFHGLRHTAATYMIKNNVPISAVSGVLGHANVSTTLNIYTHVIEDTKKEAITVMEGVFTKKTNEEIEGSA